MASTIRNKIGSASDLSKTRMILGIDILMKAVYDLPDIEMRLMTSKEQVLFHQVNPSPQVIQTINEAYEAILAQIPILKQGATP